MFRYGVVGVAKFATATAPILAGDKGRREPGPGAEDPPPNR